MAMSAAACAATSGRLGQPNQSRLPTATTRVRFCCLLAKCGQPTPVILDDALVYSDDDRIEKMFDALHRQASAQQVIVFSCRQRAFARLGGHVLRTEPWQPDG